MRFLEPLHYTVYGLLTRFTDTGATNDWSKLLDHTRIIENVFPVSTAQVIPVPGIGTTPIGVRNVNDLRDQSGRLMSRMPPDDSIFTLWGGDGPRPELCDDGRCQAGFAFFRRTDGYGGGLGAPTMAQELTHAEGLWWHAETPTEPAAPPFPFFDPAWPWYHTSTGHPGIDTRNLADPQLMPASFPGGHTHDYMSYAGGQEWVSPYTYCDLLDHFTRGVDRCSDAAKEWPSQRWVGDATGGLVGGFRVALTHEPLVASISQPLMSSSPPERAYMVLRGEVAYDGASATIEPISIVRRTTPLPFQAVGDAFLLQVVSPDARVLFEAPFTPIGTHLDGEEPRPFSFWVPAYDDADGVVIWRGDKLIAERAASAHPPTVELTSSPTGATVDAPFKVEWAASDPDNDPLTFDVEVSTDAGVIWWPVAVGLTRPELVIDLAQIPGSDAVLLRVEASDGFHGAGAQTAETFRIGDYAPTARILEPSDAATTMEYSSTLALQAEAFDWETPELSDTAFAWESDIDGSLGDGPWLTTQSLSAGEHRLTLTVTVEHGLSTSASVRVTVTPPAPALPAASPACGWASPSAEGPAGFATDP